jgi:general secretion pathway protein J
MHSARTSRRSSCGFTLLELMIALAISIGLAASLFATLHVAIKAKESGNAAVKPLAPLEIAMEMIRADLEAAQPPAGVLEYQFEGTQSGGGDAESDQLYFYNNGYASTALHPDGVGEMMLVGLLLEQQGNDLVLVRQVTTNLLTQQTPVPDEEIICRNVTSFGLQYFDGEDWQTSWDSTQYSNALPAAIAVSLQIVDPDTKRVYRARRVIALSCSAQPTQAQTAAAAAGTGTGTGAGTGAGTTGGGNAGKTGGGGAAGGGR